mmetsp:Transcript_16244/g.40425  ORF Transcript_16244/g.40425 Transcript_16244/m.40425 type:complete len:201 (+) Transcript_16244:37-639(+)
MTQTRCGGGINGCRNQKQGTVARHRNPEHTMTKCCCGELLCSDKCIDYHELTCQEFEKRQLNKLKADGCFMPFLKKNPQIREWPVAKQVIVFDLNRQVQASLNELLQARDENIASVTKERDDLAAQKEVLEEQVELLQADISKLKSEVFASQDIITNNGKTMLSLSNELKVQKGENKKLKAQLNALNQLVDEPSVQRRKR